MSTVRPRPRAVPSMHVGWAPSRLVVRTCSDCKFPNIVHIIYTKLRICLWLLQVCNAAPPTRHRSYALTPRSVTPLQSAEDYEQIYNLVSHQFILTLPDRKSANGRKKRDYLTTSGPPPDSTNERMQERDASESCCVSEIHLQLHEVVIELQKHCTTARTQTGCSPVAQ